MGQPLAFIISSLFDCCLCVQCFFQKHDAGSFGDDVKHVGIREKDGHEEAYLFIDTPNGGFSLTS